jgi:hypothetical protein
MSKPDVKLHPFATGYNVSTPHKIVGKKTHPSFYGNPKALNRMNTKQIFPLSDTE